MEWVKARKCEALACVEAAFVHGHVGVRNSRVPNEVVWFESEEWSVFIDGVKVGDFDHVDPGRVFQ